MHGLADRRRDAWMPVSAGNGIALDARDLRRDDMGAPLASHAAFNGGTACCDEFSGGWGAHSDRPGLHWPFDSANASQPRCPTSPEPARGRKSGWRVDYRPRDETHSSFLGRWYWPPAVDLTRWANIRPVRPGCRGVRATPRLDDLPAEVFARRCRNGRARRDSSRFLEDKNMHSDGGAMWWIAIAGQTQRQGHADCGMTIGRSANAGNARRGRTVAWSRERAENCPLKCASRLENGSRLPLRYRAGHPARFAR